MGADNLFGHLALREWRLDVDSTQPGKAMTYRHATKTAPASQSVLAKDLVDRISDLFDRWSEGDQSALRDLRELVDIDTLHTDLQRFERSQAQVLELRILGKSSDEISEILGVRPVEVSKRWRAVKLRVIDGVTSNRLPTNPIGFYHKSCSFNVREVVIFVALFLLIGSILLPKILSYHQKYRMKREVTQMAATRKHWLQVQQVEQAKHMKPIPYAIASFETVSRYWAANNLCSLGNVFYSRGELELAEEKFLAALDHHENLDKLDVAKIQVSLGEVLHAQGRLDEAKALLNRALLLQQTFVDVESGLIRKNLSTVSLQYDTDKEAVEVLRNISTICDRSSIIWEKGIWGQETNFYLAPGSEFILQEDQLISLEPGFYVYAEPITQDHIPLQSQQEDRVERK